MRSRSSSKLSRTPVVLRRDPGVRSQPPTRSEVNPVPVTGPPCVGSVRATNHRVGTSVDGTDFSAPVGGSVDPRVLVRGPVGGYLETGRWSRGDRWLGVQARRWSRGRRPNPSDSTRDLRTSESRRPTQGPELRELLVATQSPDRP